MAGRKKAVDPVIDIHAHVKWYGYNAEKLVANMDEHGIDVMWLLTWEAPPHEIDLPHHYTVFWPGRLCLPFADVVEAVEQYPERFLPFYAPDPRQPGALEKLQGAVERGGIRGCGEMKCRIMMDDPHALQMWHYCGEKGLPVIFHLDVPLPRHALDRSPGYWYCCDWDNLARALERCPKTIFIGHGPGFWREMSADADSSPLGYPEGPVKAGGRLERFLNRYPNLHCDLSAGSGLNALSRDPAHGRRFLLEYQDRCYFGRDYFDARLHDFIRSCRLEPAVYRKLMGGNAQKLVPLKS
jgi:predicted TIM-barrel fold metal-dependent hydrolase